MERKRTPSPDQKDGRHSPVVDRTLQFSATPTRHQKFNATSGNNYSSSNNVVADLTTSSGGVGDEGTTTQAQHTLEGREDAENELPEQNVIPRALRLNEDIDLIEAGLVTTLPWTGFTQLMASHDSPAKSLTTPSKKLVVRNRKAPQELKREELNPPVSGNGGPSLSKHSYLKKNRPTSALSTSSPKPSKSRASTSLGFTSPSSSLGSKLPGIGSKTPQKRTSASISASPSVLSKTAPRPQTGGDRSKRRAVQLLQNRLSHASDTAGGSSTVSEHHSTDATPTMTSPVEHRGSDYGMSDPSAARFTPHTSGAPNANKPVTNPLDVQKAHDLIENSAVTLLSDTLVVPTMDATLTDMRTISDRVGGMLSALSRGKNFEKPALSVTDDAQVTDPQLILIDSLKRTVEILRTDIATHLSTVRRLERELAEKDKVIEHLRSEIDEMAAEDMDCSESFASSPIAGKKPGGVGFTTPAMPSRAGRKSVGGEALAALAARRSTTFDDNMLGDGGRFSHRLSIFGGEVAACLRSGGARSRMGTIVGSSASGPMNTLLDVQPGGGRRRTTFRRLSQSVDMDTFRSGESEAFNSFGHFPLNDGGSGGGAELPSGLIKSEHPAIVASTLRILDPPDFNDDPPMGNVTFLALRVPHIDDLIDKNNAIMVKAMQALSQYTQHTIKQCGGHMISATPKCEYLAVFHDLTSAALCALKLQEDLNSKTAVDWPQGLSDLDLEKTSDVPLDHHASAAGGGAAPTGPMLWHGLRVAMAVYRKENAATVRDLCSGEMCYYGMGVKMAQLLLQEDSFGGMIVLTERDAAEITAQSIELEEPVVVTHKWKMLPGAAEPEKLRRMMPRRLGGRTTDIETLLRRQYSGTVFKAICGEVSPVEVYESMIASQDGSDLESSGSFARHRSFSPKHQKPASTEDLASEQPQQEPVEVSNLKKEEADDAATEPAPKPPRPPTPSGGKQQQHTAKTHSATPENDSSRGNSPLQGAAELELEALLQPIPAFQEAKSTANSGDQCVVLITIPSYKAMVKGTDETTVNNYLRRYHLLLKDVRPMQGNTFCEVRTKGSNVLYAFNDVHDAVKFSLQLQERALTISWPDALELQPYVRPQYYRNAIIQSGPPIHVSMHFCKVKAVKELFNAKGNLYASDELLVLETMAADAATRAQEAIEGGYPVCSCISVSEVVYAGILFRDKSQCQPQTGGYATPLILPNGLLDIPDKSSLWPMYTLVPKTQVGKVFLGFQQQLKEGRITRAAIWNHILGEWSCRCQEQQMLPSPHTLSESETITGNVTQALTMRCHFDRVKSFAVMNATYKVLHRQYSTSGSQRDSVALEQMESAMMETHDQCIPSTAPAPFMNFSALILRKLLLQQAMPVGGVMVPPSTTTPAAAMARRSSGGVLDSSMTPRATKKGSRTATPSPLEDVSDIDETGGDQLRVERPKSAANSRDQGGTPTTTVDAGQAAAALDSQQDFFIQRSQKIDGAIMATHKLLQCFFESLKLYMAPLADDNSPIVGDDDFIVRLVQLKRQLFNEEEEEEEEAKAAAALSGNQLEVTPTGVKKKPAKVGEQWRAMMSQHIEIDDGDSSRYDAVRLCRSMIAQCCKYFLFARTVNRRVNRNIDSLRAKQSGGPNSTDKMAGAVNAVMFRKRMEKRKATEGSDTIEKGD